MTSPVQKNAASTPKIGTHNGKFHCDEVFATYLLKLLPQYKHAEIIRTRDKNILDTCDIVVDVGDVYDPSRQRFDHHQRGFTETMNSVLKTKPWTIKLSSAGLVYCHFGHELLRTLIPEAQDEKFREALFDQLYTHFVMEIDAIDNGIPMFDGEPKYHIHSGLSSRVSHLNPPWNSPPEDAESITSFTKAMELVGKEFEDRLNYYAKSWWPARSIVQEAIDNRFKIHKSGEVIELTTMCPWKEHFFELINEMGIENGVIKFAVFYNPSSSAWYVNATPINSSSFVCHRFLLKPWRSLRDDKLSEVSGIKDCIFTHANGFIGGNKNREGALEMAIKSVEAGKQADDGVL